MAGKNLHEALASFGITSKPGTIPSKRILIQCGQEIGHYDAHEAWDLVRDLSGSRVEAPSPSA
jgi:hypothetical protein